MEAIIMAGGYASSRISFSKGKRRKKGIKLNKEERYIPNAIKIFLSL